MHALVKLEQSRGVPTAYLAFEGESHGFRKAQNQIRSLEAELRQLVTDRANLRARKERFAKVAREIAARAPKQKTDSVEIIRQMREDRMNELGC